MILENSFGKEMMMAKIQCMAKVTEVSVLAEGIVSMWLLSLIHISEPTRRS